MLTSLIADARFAARRLRARPVYASVAVLTLALGVGGTASTYSVARGVLFDPLPYTHTSEIGVFWKKTDWTEEEFLHIRGRVPGFREVALYRVHDVILREGDEPPRLLPGLSAFAELFDVLGVASVLGRGFQPGDDVPGAEPVAVLSYVWRELGSEPSILGKRLTLDGMPRTVVGVMPRGFWFPTRCASGRRTAQRGAQSWNSTLVGRVAPGHDVRAMEAPVARLTAMLDERFDYPAQWDKTKNAQITPIRDDLMGDMRAGAVRDARGDGAHSPHRLRERRRADAGPGRGTVCRSLRCGPRSEQTAGD